MSITYSSTSFGTQVPRPSSRNSLAGSPGGRSSRQSFHSLNTYQNSIASRSSYGVATTTDDHDQNDSAKATHAASQNSAGARQPNAVDPSSAVETEAQKVARLLAEKEAMDEAISQFFGGGRRKSTRVPVPVISESEVLEAEATPSSSNEPRSVRVVSAQYDAIGAFFGTGRRSSAAPAPSPSVDSPVTQTAANHASAPSYSSDARSMLDSESLPSYSKVEPKSIFTFNRKLFFYGFFFPPLWIVGMIMPFVTPDVPDASIDSRPREEKVAELTQLRVVEFRWALRCAAALLALVILGAVAAVLAIVLTRRK